MSEAVSIKEDGEWEGLFKAPNGMKPWRLPAGQCPKVRIPLNCDVQTAIRDVCFYVDSSRPVSAKSGHTRTARRTGQNDPLLPSKIGPANGMKARESGCRLKAWRRTRGNYSATAARLTLKARRLRRGRSRSDRSALAHHTRRTGSTRSAGGVSRTRTDSASNVWPTASLCARTPAEW
jgi:hypothetical protein